MERFSSIARSTVLTLVLTLVLMVMFACCYPPYVGTHNGCGNCYTPYAPYSSSDYTLWSMPNFGYYYGNFSGYSRSGYDCVEYVPACYNAVAYRPVLFEYGP